jgi:DNA-binding NarL/FixJ family response regulator
MHSIVNAAYHPLVLKGINQVIKEKYSSSKVIGQTTSVKGLITLLRKYKPDTAIIDVSITWDSKVDLLEEIRQVHPALELHLICVHPVDRIVRDYLENKAKKALQVNVGDYVNKKDLTAFPSSDIDGA